MKKLIITLAAILLQLSCVAANYRGMIDAGGGAIFVNTRIRTSTGEFKHESTSGSALFSTTHGCQLTPNIFVGAGLGILCEWPKGSKGDSDLASLEKNRLLTIPLYADIRWDLNLNRKFSPFADLRIGYQLNHDSYAFFKAYSVSDPSYITAGWVHSDDSMYIQVSAGGRMNIGKNLGISLGLSFIPILKRTITIGVPMSSNRCGLMLNAGFDFQGSGKSTTKQSKKERLQRLQQRELEKKSKKFDIK